MYGYGFYGNWRPELDYETARKIYKDAKKQATESVRKFGKTLPEVRELGLEHHRERQEKLKGLIPTPYPLFLNAYFEVMGETEREHTDRLILNYLRHVVTDYDKILFDTKEEWWVPHDFFDDLWNAVMDGIVAVYPQLKRAKKRGWEAKQFYSRIRDSYGIDWMDEKEEKVFWTWDNLMEDRKAQIYEEEEKYEEEMRQLRKENQEEWKKWRHIRSARCRQVSPIFKQHEGTIPFKRNGTTYDAEIVKVNPVKIRVRYFLKISGAEKVEDVFACYLYEDNADILPKIEGYEPFSEVEKPERLW